MELNKLCRTCLITAENMTSLYETCVTTQICCAEILSTFTPLICVQTDGYPTTICSNCIGELNRFHIFRLKCLESDETLRKYLEITVIGHKSDPLDLIKQENIEHEERIFEEVSVKSEFPLTLETTFDENPKDPQTDIKDPLIISELDQDPPANDPEKEKPYSCTLCSNAYRKKQSLQIHMRTHTGENPYSCTFCNSSFYTKQQLTFHMRTHTGEKPYTCTICNISVHRQESLKIHMRTHTGEKPYACTICDSSFKQKQNLSAHMRTHSKEKPYPCTVCDTSFKHKHHLTDHLRTHTGEKPYSCAICYKSFGQKQHLSGHMRIHTREKSYPCTNRKDP